MSSQKLLSQVKQDVRQKLKYLKYRYKGIQYVHFLHIGKTGGTAISEIVRNHLLTEKYEICLHGHGFKLRDVPIGEKAVFFLRDPISRYASGFYERKRRGRRGDNHWRSREEPSLNRFETPQELASALASDDETLHAAALYAMKNVGHIKSSYWDWFEDESYFISRLPDVLYIGFQETLNQDFDCLKQKLHLPKHIQLPNDPIKANRFPQTRQAVEFNDMERRALLDWYADDYAFLNLCQRLVQSGHF